VTTHGIAVCVVHGVLIDLNLSSLQLFGHDYYSVEGPGQGLLVTLNRIWWRILSLP